MTSLKCKCIEMNLLTPGEYYGHFLFTPLEGGEGATLANMIRRSLLSSLFESKISGVRFAGVNDEFSNMQGVREDLLEIILNLKEVVIKNSSYKSCYGRIKVYGPAIVTASSLVLPKGVTIINPRSHILTVCEKALVELEVRIEPRKVYSLPQNRETEGTGNFINVDSNFTPVLKVNSYIESISQDPEPFSQATKNKNEELHIEIYTNGALLPHQALMIAGNRLAAMVLSFQKILFYKKVKGKIIDTDDIKTKDLTKKASSKNYKKLSEKHLVKSPSDSENIDGKNLGIDDSTNTLDSNPMETLIESQDIKTETKRANINKIRNSGNKRVEKNLERKSVKAQTLEEFGLSKRVINALIKLNINNVNDLLQVDSKDLANLNGLGAVSLKEINDKITTFAKLPIHK